MIISPSIASANQLHIAREIDYVASQYNHLHIDIEDGNFIPNITFGMKTLNQICEYTNLSISLHLMTTDPLFWIDNLKHNVDIIYLHIENLKYPSEAATIVKQRKMKLGFAFNPSTPLAPYQYLFNEVDSILIMTSEPDCKDQRFIPGMLDKARQAKDMKMNVWLDGGIMNERFEEFACLGVDGVVVGRSIFQKKH